MCHVLKFFRIAPLIIMISCSIQEESPLNSEKKSETNSQSEVKTPTSHYQSYGNCKIRPGEGCIGGYISHGTEINVTYGEGGDVVSFRDAADLNDRFAEAFIEPILKKSTLNPSDYKITLSPEINRNNFAVSFEQFLEGSKAYSAKVINGEGNFSFPGIDNGSYNYRMTKQYTLIIRKNDTDETQEQCIVFEYSKDDISIDNQDPSTQIIQLGGIRDFTYYFRPKYGRCNGSLSLPQVEVKIPNIESTIQMIPVSKRSTSLIKSAKALNFSDPLILEGVTKISGVSYVADEIFITGSKGIGFFIGKLSDNKLVTRDLKPLLQKSRWARYESMHANGRECAIVSNLAHTERVLLECGSGWTSVVFTIDANTMDIISDVEIPNPQNSMKWSRFLIDGRIAYTANGGYGREIYGLKDGSYLGRANFNCPGRPVQIGDEYFTVLFGNPQSSVVKCSSDGEEQIRFPISSFPYNQLSYQLIASPDGQLQMTGCTDTKCVIANVDFVDQ